MLELYRKRPGKIVPEGDGGSGAGSLSIEPLEGSRSRLAADAVPLWELKVTSGSFCGQNGGWSGKRGDLEPVAGWVAGPVKRYRVASESDAG